LAKRVNTPIANLVSEAAEMILNFSEVHHRLQQQYKSDVGNDDEDAATSPPPPPNTTQLIQRDATKVVDFISKANPQLAKEYSHRTFIPNHFLSTEIITTDDTELLPPMHPIVVDIRARLLSGKIRDVAKICRHLEECSGLSLQVKQHSWMLLLEKMHVGGTLIEDGSSPLNDDNGGGEVLLTLRNIVVGSIGRSCVLGNIWPMFCWKLARHSTQINVGLRKPNKSYFVSRMPFEGHVSNSWYQGHILLGRR